MSFLQKLWMCFNLNLFSGVINPLQPTSNAVSLGLMEVTSVNIHEYLLVLYLLFFEMLLSWPAVNSQISTVFFFMSLITIVALLWSASTQRKTTVTWKWNPCRNSVVFSAAARGRQNATDRTERGSDTLVLRTKSYNLFRTQSHSYGNKHPQTGSKWLVSWKLWGLWYHAIED